MTDRELFQKCLDTLEHHVSQRTLAGGVVITNVAIALRERLAQPDVVEVVAVHPDGTRTVRVTQPDPQPLTNEQIFDATKNCSGSRYDIARAIERAHGIGGGDDRT